MFEAIVILFIFSIYSINKMIREQREENVLEIVCGNVATKKNGGKPVPGMFEEISKQMAKELDRRASVVHDKEFETSDQVCKEAWKKILELNEKSNKGFSPVVQEAGMKIRIGSMIPKDFDREMVEDIEFTMIKG